MNYMSELCQGAAVHAVVFKLCYLEKIWCSDCTLENYISISGTQPSYYFFNSSDDFKV